LFLLGATLCIPKKSKKNHFFAISLSCCPFPFQSVGSIMPRKNNRQRFICRLEAFMQWRKKQDTIRRLLRDNSDEEDSMASLNEIIDATVQRSYHRAVNSRYSYRNSYRKSYSAMVFERVLEEEDDDGGTTPWFTENEFLQHFRMHRSSFAHLVELIKDNDVFKGDINRKQAPVEHQLLVLLMYLGTTGSGASNARLRGFFGVGGGTIELFRNRCVTAIRSLRQHAITWPDEVERRIIARRIRKEYDWPNTVGIADGTLFPLTYEPQSEDAPDYSGRKFKYSLTVMIVNDDNRRVRYYYAGMPGSCHDARVYRQTKLFKNPAEYFSPDQFIVADSALPNSPTVVSAFKSPTGYALGEEEQKFNTHLGRLRVLSEHTIGILKGRFPWLKSIPMVVTDKPSSLRKILQYIDCCIIMHNLMIERDDEVPDDWCDTDDISLIDVAEELNEGVNNEQSPPDARRRNLHEMFQQWSIY
jgi:hypothetical protein